ncbi:MAG TPA: hypothetical protein VMJ75_15425 [Candidatus Acidoferrales bacterium]|nr:hypothetical protein [Candidatus Acidoferrales bacterium]
MFPLLRTILFAAACAGTVHAQLSPSAYRVLGQVDLRHNGVNLVQGTELNQPLGMALDTRNGQTHVYICDTQNSRVLAWADAASYQIGDAPALVLGQPGPQYSAAQGIGTKGFTSPVGLAVNPQTGDLYVADYGNSRVLRFLSPFANPTRVEPDAVYGQPNFTNHAPGAPSNATLTQPRGVAFDSAGNMWVADGGNNRVVRFAAGVLNSPTPTADTVIGQKDFFSIAADAGGTVSGSGFDLPSGLAFDAQDNLYVSDGRNARVLKFSAPLGPSNVNPTASAVWGQSNFSSRVVPQQPTSSSMTIPGGLAVDGSGNVYVTAPADNRVLVFPPGSTLGGPAKSVLGQSDFTTTTANTGANPLASPNSLSGPSDVKVDQSGNVFVVDTSNNRVLEFPPNTKAATKVWGQSDFVSNGVNQIKPGSIDAPFKMAIDYSSAPFALYIADTGNNRVLVWKDSVHFRNGDPADLVIGQPNLRTGVANVDTQGSPNPSRTSLSAPEGIAVNPADGTLYVADSGNNRVLRFPRPVNQSGRISPDAVIGQLDFTSSVSASVNASSLNAPAGLAIGPNGDLFVSDSNNNRVLEFAAGAGTGASAVRVFGQPSMTTALRPTQASPQTLASPQGLAVDPASNLYVVDLGANRVLIYPNTQNAPPAGIAATFVIGQGSFGAVSGTGIYKNPTDVAVDSNGNIYVADSGNNRVLIYSSLVFLPIAGASATGVVGQQTTNGGAPNWDTPDGLATAEGLYGPVGIYLDRQDTLYVGDAGNNRVVQFLKAATVVNAATFAVSIPVSPGALASLFGGGLASDTATISATTWPRTVVNRQLVINDQLQAPIYYAGPSQVNFQVPSNAPLGTDRIAVRTADTGELVAGGSLLVAAASPGIFTTGQTGTGQAAAVNQDGTINSPSNPAPVGSTILLYGTGQGQTSPSVPDGTAAPGPPGLAQTIAVPTSNPSTCLNSQPSMCVAIGSSGFGNVVYSGLAPGYIGLWQINVTIPQGTASGGAVPIRVLINGSPSNAVTIAVR